MNPRIKRTTIAPVTNSILGRARSKSIIPSPGEKGWVTTMDFMQDRGPLAVSSHAQYRRESAISITRLLEKSATRGYYSIFTSTIRAGTRHGQEAEDPHGHDQGIFEIAPVGRIPNRRDRAMNYSLVLFHTVFGTFETLIGHARRGWAIHPQINALGGNNSP